MIAFLDALYPILLTTITGFFGTVAVQAYKYIVAKVGITVLERNQKFAMEVWNAIEEDGRLGALLDTKVAVFKKVIKDKYPKMTDETILLLNKSIAGVVNAGKEIVVKVVQSDNTSTEPTLKISAESAINETPVILAVGIDKEILDTIEAEVSNVIAVEEKLDSPVPDTTKIAVNVESAHSVDVNETIATIKALLATITPKA